MNARRSLLTVAAISSALLSCGRDEAAAPATSGRAAPTTTTAAATTVEDAAATTAPATTAPATTAPATTAPAPATTAPPPSFDGREFISTSVVGWELVPGTEITLRFDADQIGATAGCNQLTSTWSLDGDVLTVADMAQTELACEPATRMDQDTWLASFLTSDPVVALDGDTLTMTVGPSSMTLLDREVARPDQPLEGPTWTVESLVSGDAVSSVPLGGRAPTLSFAAGQVTVDTGCNTGSGTYVATEAELTFSPLALTRIGCEPAVMEAEAAIVTVLEGAVAFTIDADQLTLTKGDQGLVARSS